MAKSIEEKIEDHAKSELKKLNLKYYTKTEIINESIDEALNKAPSKKGGDGINRPDIKLFIQTATLKNLPVMIEVKGTKGDLAKFDDDGNIANQNSKNEPNYSNISKYALNGAIHYADAVTFYSDFADCIAIGINGYENSGKITIEYAVYLVSNPKIYKKLGDFSDLSFLASSDLDDLIKNCELSQEEIEAKTAQIENEMEVRLKNLNETIHHTYGVAVQYRVEIVVGIIMANLGIANHISPLVLNDLKGENTPNSNDGKIILNKISDYLEHKNLNLAKKDMILRELTKVFIDTNLWKSQNGQSRLKQIYKIVLENVMPYLKNNKYHLDFTGQLFNVLNRYVDIPDGEKNDVVLTPRYVTDLMAKLCEVNKDSFVWDYAMGSGGFLISSLKLMLADAKNSINSSSELEDKLFHIKSKQLLGVELRPDICLLAILNMILMGDGSANVINTDSLINYEGNYQDQSTPFPANVFLLNPPYSADGKGFNFVEKALSKMKSGKAAVLIQENAGSGNGLPYTKEILKRSTLKASIKMSDIFCGKAGVQTAIYLFEVGRPHNEKSIVKFIDFSNDGYSRQNRKKSGLNVNLKDADNAESRYTEIVDIVLDRKKSSDFYNEANGTLILDTISLNGKDWTFAQHKKIDTKPNLEDFKKCVSDFLAWEVSNIIKSEQNEPKDLPSSKAFESINWKEFRIGDLFEKIKTKKLPYKTNDLPSHPNTYYDLPVLTAGIENQGLNNYAPRSNATILKNVISISANGANTGVTFYQNSEFTVLQDAYAIKWIFNNNSLSDNQFLFLTSAIRKAIYGNYDWSNKAGWEKIKNDKISLPITQNGEIDFNFMESFISEIEESRVRKIKEYLKATGLTDATLTQAEQKAIEAIGGV